MKVKSSVGKTFFSLFIILIMGANTSCFRYYKVSTDTYADVGVIPKGFTKGKTFCVLYQHDENPLLAKEVGRKIQTLLREKGYRITEANEADYTLVFSYEMTSEKKTQNVPKYIPGKTSEFETSYHDKSGKEKLFKIKNESASKVVFVSETKTVYTKVLKLEAFENKRAESTQQDPIWSGVVNSQGSDSDLRKTVDYLLVSIFGYFGQSSNKNMESVLFEGNSDVKRLREKSF